MKKRLAIAGWLLAGCVHPNVIVLDRATALEEQAGGSFDELELKLARGGITPHPTPFTPEELEALGIHSQDLVSSAELTEVDQVDAFLRQRCLGESRNGLLVQTPEACQGAADPDLLQRLAEHQNRARTLLWKWMQHQHPSGSVDDVQRNWQQAHGRALVCGAWHQRSNGTWEVKKCGS